MSHVVVAPVAARSEQKLFLEFPWRHYRGDPNWVPPLRQNQKELVGFAWHPFYDDAQSQAFLATRGGEVCGRILALVNHAHNRYYDEKRGFFGFFETVDDPAVAHGLFDAACDWLRSQGMTAVRGPVNPSLNYECGLLTEGFDSPPTFMMTYNKPFYGGLIESYGFEKAQDLYAYSGHVDMLKSLDKKLAFVVQEAAERFHIKVRPFDPKRFKQELAAFLHIYNESLVGTWGFVPLSEAEGEHMGKGLKHLIVPELAILAEIDGRIVGSTFGLLDYNPRIKAMDGRLFPFGFLKLLFGRRKIKRVRLLSTNVLPEYQRWGVGLVLVNGLVPKVLDWGIEYGEFSWVLESNHLSRKTLERGGAIREKTFRIYDRAL
ncbi:MAG: N-acetyltransferase [Planctomycetota bacterium]|nr:MAG: N-acetyltransferase [Planctomycetota bacterium]